MTDSISVKKIRTYLNRFNNTKYTLKWQGRKEKK